MRYTLFFLLIAFTLSAQAQSPARVVMHLQSSDTLVYKSIVNQIGNIKKELPNAEIEVVCHGPGLEFLRKDKAFYVNKIQRMNLSQVSFVGCEYTMQQRNYKKEDLVPYAQTVPYGLVEIIKKQQADWIYVKLGF
ncbi:MAG: DsrE family protein [Cyclobacteriaceae bacterium]|jgi:hypothetical protein|nr:DsrE family protein [Cyclobacteriaceae bacterium]